MGKVENTGVKGESLFAHSVVWLKGRIPQGNLDNKKSLMDSAGVSQCGRVSQRQFLRQSGVKPGAACSKQQTDGLEAEMQFPAGNGAPS